jgi:hypothetical protein
MKLNLRQATWAFALAITLTVFGAPNFAGAFQGDRRGPDNNRNGRYNDRNGRNDNLAAQMGAQDGLNDGRKDRATGHSNRPTKGDNYKNATRGFAGGDGQTAYKAAYRQAYVPAYQQGYNERVNGRR